MSFDEEEKLAQELEDRVARRKKNTRIEAAEADHLASPAQNQASKRMSIGDKYKDLTGTLGADTPIDKALGERRGSLKIAKEAKDLMQKVVDDANKTEAKGSNTHLQKFLKIHTVSQLLETVNKDVKVIEVDGSASPQEGFEVLLRNNILGAPVWDKKRSKYVGFLDIRDLVSALVFSRDSKKLPDWQEQMVHGLENISTRRGSFEEKKK